MTAFSKCAIMNYQIKEDKTVFAIFDAEGTLVGMITLNSAQHTNIIDVLEDADYRVRFLDNIWDMINKEED